MADRELAEDVEKTLYSLLGINADEVSRETLDSIHKRLFGGRTLKEQELNKAVNSGVYYTSNSTNTPSDEFKCGALIVLADRTSTGRHIHQVYLSNTVRLDTYQRWMCERASDDGGVTWSEWIRYQPKT